LKSSVGIKMSSEVISVSCGAEKTSHCPSDFSTYEELLVHLKINPETVLLFHDGKVVPRDAQPRAGQLKVVRVVSGG